MAIGRNPTDFSILGYYADIPGIGLNLSALLSDKTTAYAELSVRKGRNQQRPVLDEHNTFTGIREDSNRWFSDLVVGWQYTSDLGLTFTAEYWRNTHGYSNSEYVGIANAIRNGQVNGQLAGSLINVPNLRRNKLFFRISDIKPTVHVGLEVATIYNIDDHSQLIRSVANWDLTNADSLRVGIDKFLGAALSEYGANPVNLRLFFIYKRIF